MKPLNVLIEGDSELSEEFAPIATSLGSRLMTETSFVLLTGGLASKGPEYKRALDGYVVEAAVNAAKERGIVPDVRVMTMLPEKDVDGFKRTRNNAGRIIYAESSNVRTRRYSMVLNADAIVVLGGHKATREILELAYMAGKPMLPIPATGGSALEAWERHKEELRQTFDAEDSDVQALYNARDAETLVSVCIKLLHHVLRPRCFVAMPFSDHPIDSAFRVIQSVVEQHGYRAVRTDQGHDEYYDDIVKAIWEAIHSSDIVIADLSNHNPNVYYELGISHALGKPTYLIIYSKDRAVPDNIPFDVRVKRIIPYTDRTDLEEQLKTVLPTFGEGKSGGSLETSSTHPFPPWILPPTVPRVEACSPVPTRSKSYR